MKRTSLLRILPIALAFAALAGCSSDDTDPVGPGPGGNDTTSTTTTVKITPTTATAFVGDTVKLAATVTGNSNTAVTWSVTPSIGTVSSTGEYITPTSITGDSVIVTIKAVSVAASTASATATITVKGPPFVAVIPGVGSNYLESSYLTDSAGVRDPNSDAFIITNVEDPTGTFQGFPGVTTYHHAGGDITYLRHDRSGDVYYGQSAVTDADGNVLWLRLPFGSKQAQGAVLSSTADYTLRYDATYVAQDQMTVNGNTLTIYKVKLTTVGTRTGANARVTTVVTDLAFAPSIGWFGKFDEALTRVDSDGTFKSNKIRQLTNYSLK